MFRKGSGASDFDVWKTYCIIKRGRAFSEWWSCTCKIGDTFWKQPKRTRKQETATERKEKLYKRKSYLLWKRKTVTSLNQSLKSICQTFWNSDELRKVGEKAKANEYLHILNEVSNSPKVIETPKGVWWAAAINIPVGWRLLWNLGSSVAEILWIWNKVKKKAENTCSWLKLS